VSEIIATPAGFESVPNSTRPHVECINARQNGVLDEATSSHVGPNCNDCNEVTPRLARVAKNAHLNGDFPRVIGILDRLSSQGLSDEDCKSAS
jgi:hypothetical protein